MLSQNIVIIIMANSFFLVPITVIVAWKSYFLWNFFFFILSVEERNDQLCPEEVTTSRDLKKKKILWKVWTRVGTKSSIFAKDDRRISQIFFRESTKMEYGTYLS